MEFWITFWAITLGLVLLLYAGLFLWVAIGGLSDIRAMLASLKAEEDGETAPDER